ncbi:MAG: glutathione S-transferase [Burkholderiaceae bacterium]|nr:glutathione S-transferase [Burkholderiaceae bacterium]
MAVSAPAAAPYPVLYSFRRCPYAMRARLALAASDTVCELREVVLAHKPAALLQASPKGTVPVLVLPEGVVLEQSLDIMLWALRRNDPQQWLPGAEQDMVDALKLIRECDGDFKVQLDRYKYPNRYALPDGLGQRAQGANFLRMLDQRLAGQSYLTGERFGLVDAAIAPFVRQFAHTDPAWFASEPWPALQQWLATFEASGDYAKVMNKLVAWTEGQAVQRFPT